MQLEMKKLLEQNNLKADDYICQNFEKYFFMLEEWNKKFNLTRITEKSEVAEKHFLDSILPESLIPQNAKVIDIGAGAGFPSIPLKIYRNDINITMIDSLNKRISFLSAVINELNLSNSATIHTRSEDLAHNQNYRESFDIALARAVAPLNTLVEYCLPFVKIGGAFLAYKSFDSNTEVAEAEKSINTLGGKIENIFTYSTSEEIKRKVVVIRKISTSKNIYPRGKNLPRTAPII